ncbi:MAG: DUF4139 domain-containing protein [Alphaproteobacteria bacterium]|nr:DUF4139 domain-containing protein [Alphaproteobacteria bacterium]
MRLFLMITLCLTAGISSAFAQENLVSEDKRTSLDISIYNQNMAFVKDVRSTDLSEGINDIAFEGVASAIKPETAILFADEIKVLEQNYDYDLLTPVNILDKSVGQKVKTAVVNPMTGSDIFNHAEIVSTAGNMPVLAFDYGIETEFPGRIIFEKLPQGLRSKPSLVAKIISQTQTKKDISLAYLTNGINWKTDYVAKVEDDNHLDLTGWVTINNESGTDYKDARIQLIAGSVNEVPQVVSGRRFAVMKAAVAIDYAADNGISEGASEQDLSGYHLYTLPKRTTIKDKQKKQISLIEKNAVKYKKEAVIENSLYFAPSSGAQFEQVHPAMFYVMKNEESENLGLQLPAGIIRFYENDDDGNLQFIGENSIGHTAEKETIRLRLGSFVNIFADGKVKKTQKLSSGDPKPDGNRCKLYKDMYAYDAEIKVTNSSSKPQEAVYKQSLPADTVITAENIKGISKNASTFEWRFEVPAKSEKVLEFSLKSPYSRRVCD